MKSPIRVVLTEPELEYATSIGELRHSECVKRGYQNKHGYSGEDAGIDILGACGELAFCKGIGLEWEASINSFKAPDAGSDIQVRTSPCKAAVPPDNFGRLIVREEDNIDHRYVLVVGNPPNFVIKGWIRGSNARQDKWIRIESGRPPAWFVPFQELDDDLSGFMKATGAA